MNRLENRVRKLEALRGTNPLQELDDHGQKALLIILEAQIEAEQRGGMIEITEAALAKQRMTLAEFDEASRQLTPAFWTRVAAHMERQRSATTTRNYRPCGRLPTYVATTRGPFSEADGRSRI